MEAWSPHVKKLHDPAGNRWYFLFHHQFLADRAPDEQPYALHFRNDDRTVFGVLRFERANENPHGEFTAVTRKILDDPAFRASLIDSTSHKVWSNR